ncbi:hypothetical protein KUCAC02_032998 [Chaenocephalus aceratus]|nr:hypothetical protein KUCAC02_032998 [Chaenocephalus aceratus]
MWPVCVWCVCVCVCVRGVIRVDVNIQDMDLDQCSEGDGWFSDSHQCNRTTMECIATPGQGFRLGQYCCRCRDGYYDPETIPQDSDGGFMNSSIEGVCYPDLPVCLPCWPGCSSCRDGTPCWVQQGGVLRGAVLTLQGIFMILIFVSMLVAYRHRRNRRIRASGLLLLETILFGSLLLYFPVFIMYFKPSTFRCILLRWVRMLGFSIVYGTVTLKMYRVLKVFLSRTAQRVPYLSSLYLLRILGVMLLMVSWFLCAWTVGVLQNRDRNIPVFITTNTSDGQGFNLCFMDRWDYMMAVAELLFLCWEVLCGPPSDRFPPLSTSRATWASPSTTSCSSPSIFHLFRFTFSSLHPDWMLLLSFMHTHVTITVTLALLFIPKFLYVSKPAREEIAAEVYEDEVDLRRSGSYLNSSFRSAWSEHSGVDPDDFRDELKKLYAQLEVHKTKKMTAKNPHLSKKQSSRYAIGRSIIKRIAEIPESMSRRCSRDDREGSFLSKSVHQSESSKRAPDSVTISLKKLCKSASAQNLSIDINLLHPDHTRLQKSWSLTSASRSLMENIPKVTRASTVLTRSGQSLSISEQTRSALQSESFDKSDVCPWEEEQEQPGDKNQKHVTYATSMESEDNEATSPKGLVCPWENLPPVEKKPSEDSETLETDYPKLQASVSASAPCTPRPKFTKDQRIFSFRSAASTWLSVKTAMVTLEAASKSSVDGKPNKEDSVSLKSHESVSSRRPSMEKRSLLKSMTTVNKPCLVKQNAIRRCSGDSLGRRLSTGKCAVYPWDTDETQKDGNHESVILSRQNSRRSTSSWETASSCRTPSTHRRGSNRITPVRNMSFVNVCPWEGAGTSQGEEGPKRQQTIQVDVCPWESQEEDYVREQGSGKSETCPWETQDIPVISYTNTSRDLQTQQSLKPAADVCPWETAESPQPSIGQEGEYVNVCPWDVKDKAEVEYEYLNRLGSRGSLSVPLKHDVFKLAVHPSASTKGYEGQQLAQSEAVHSGEQVTKAAESCPWDFPDPLKTLETSVHGKRSEEKDATKVNICPWETDRPQTTEATKIVSHGLERSSDVFPWDTKAVKTQESKASEEPNTRGNVCPWDTEALEVLKKQDTVPANVCPWDTEEPKVLKKEDTVQKDVCPWDTGEPKVLQKEDTVQKDVCPWDTGEPKVLQKQDSVQKDVCPWDTGETKVLKKEDTVAANVCPWDTEEPKVLQKQDSVQKDVCPWDTGEPKVLQKQDSVQKDVCPWDTGETKVLQKQDSVQKDVCPWDTGEPKELKKEDTVQKDVCPWDTGEPKELKKEDTVQKDVCPWDTGETKVLKKEDGVQKDVCPWDTGETKVLKKEDGVQKDVCPWDTGEPKVLRKQDSVQKDVCPWDTGEPKELKKQDSGQKDVCPWDTEEPEVVQKEGSTAGDVCPLESKDTELSSENQVGILKSDQDEVTESQRELRVEENPPDVSGEQVDGPKESLGRRDALCSWQMEGSRSGSFTDNTDTDVFTWEPENIPEEDEDDDAEFAAEALVFPSDL